MTHMSFAATFSWLPVPIIRMKTTRRSIFEMPTRMRDHINTEAVISFWSVLSDADASRPLSHHAVRTGTAR
jgi:hypothetical protein